MNIRPWRDGNRVRLLENGEEFYPRVFGAIAGARKEVLVETYILFDDPVGRQLRDVLIAAARRGVFVDLTVDGHGSSFLPDEFIASLTAAGVRFHMFDPQPRLLGMRLNVFRRLHRKQIVIDGEVAFVGGINFSHDHLRESGPEAKQDYAVEVAGPVVDDIRGVLTRAPPPSRWRRWQWWRRPAPAEAPPPRAGTAQVRLVTRDNEQHRNDIEWHYREALRFARREVVIANAYFFPGYRFLKELRRAARRGVSVRLVLQGKPDMPVMRGAALTLYGWLLRSGVKIYEYCERPFHGKVAVVDREWATVGSSNLDPLSLALNLEANLVVRDHGFASHLHRRLLHLIEHACEEVTVAQAPPRTLLRQLLNFLTFHFLRRFPAWARRLPVQTARRTRIAPPVAPTESEPLNKEAA